MKPVKGLIFVVALLLMALRAAAAQGGAVAGQAPVTQTEMQLAQWAVTQGGLVVVVLVVVWSYRRDFHRIFQSENTRTNELILALQGSTAALTAHAELMRQNADSDREHAKAFLELSAAVRACEAVRDVFQDAQKTGRIPR